MARSFGSLGRTAVSALIAAVLACAACDGYQPPCSVVSMPPFVSEPAVAGDYEAGFTLYASEERELVAKWLRLRAAPASDGLPPSLRPVAAEVAVVALTGDAALRHTLPLFEGTELDEVPTDNLGFVWTRDGIVVHWTQDHIVGTEGEEPHVYTQLMLQRIPVGGAADAPVAPFGAGCLDCIMRLSAVHAHATVVVVFTQYQEVPNGIGAGATHALTWSLPTGDVTTGPLPWLARQPATALAPRLRLDREDILLTTGTEAWIVDTDAVPLAGPFPLPSSANYAFAWSSEDTRASMAWLEDPATRDRDDAYYQSYSGHGKPLGPVERLTSAERVVAATINDDRVGVVVADRGQQYFVLVGADGAKSGGDVQLGGSSADVSAATYALLRPLGPGRYVHATGTPRRIERREILCDP